MSDQTPNPVSEQGDAPRRGNPTWRPGQSANPRGRPTAAQKRAMVEAAARTLANGAFDQVSTRDRELLLLAAALKLQPRRRGEDMVRRVNAIDRWLSRVRGGRAPSRKLTKFTA